MILNFLKPYTKEFSYNLKLAYPIIIGMIGHTLVGFVDNAMVGQLGTSELAAISLGNSFVFLAMSFGIGFSTAITTLIAESDAQNDKKKNKIYSFKWYNSLFYFRTYFDCPGFIFKTNNILHGPTRNSS